MVIDNLFQKLETEKNTIALIEKFHKKIGIEINETLVDDAISFLEIRHKLVYTDGKVDECFKKQHDNLSYTKSNYIKLSYDSIKEAKQSVFGLVKDIDSKLFKANLVYPHTKTK